MHTIWAKALPRRHLLLAAAAGGCAGGGQVLAGGADTQPDPGRLAADLRTYLEFGPKNAGGVGDTASGAWLETRLAEIGYATARQTIMAATITERDAHIRLGDARADVVTHCLGAANTFQSLSAPVRTWSAPYLMGPVERGDIIVAHLPTQRWSSAQHPFVRDTIARAFANGAAALVLVTHGPTNELIRLNRPLAAGTNGPIALLAPRDWIALRQTLADEATLTLNASASPRPAFNVTARLERSAARWLIISTPRSGWGPCGGERGPGIAAFAALAAWAPQRFAQLNIALVATSSHEFENEGGGAYLEHAAPSPIDTELWLHLGAGFAARDWHDAGARLLPLPSADPQRFLVATAELIDAARTAFRGIAGLEASYEASQGAAGELQNVIAAGYRAAGMHGAHRFHHTDLDDLRCVDADLANAVLQRLQRFLTVRLNSA